MATPAAVLSILVEAETSKATAALRTFDRSVARTGSTTTRATGTTSTFSKATGTLGGSLARAARYASGAAAAYLSIAQAKAAVATTQDLAKTTSGLHRNLGLTNKVASQWGTVAKARDIDTKSLTMSFTTLSRRLTDASKGSKTAVDTFKDIGLTQKDLKKSNGDFNQQLLMVADAFGEAEGGAQRQQAAQKLLGRGYQTLLPMFAEGADSLKEQQMWADLYGTTLDGKTVKAQMDLVNAQRESKVAWMGLQVIFAKAITPALQDLNENFHYLAGIVANDKITATEKWKALGQAIDGIFQNWKPQFEAARDKIIDALPQLAEAAGEQGPKIAAALAKGFVNADVWGKIFIGGWFMAKLGGAGFFKGQGKIAGRMFAGAFILALPSLLEDAYHLGEKVGNAVRDALGMDKPDPIKSGHPATELFGGLGELSRSQVGPNLWDDLHQSVKERSAQIEKNIKDSYKRQRQIVFEGETDFNSILETGFGKQLNITKSGLDRQETTFQNTKGKLDEITKSQAQKIAGNVGGMVNAVGQGLKTLGTNTNKALQAFGAKKLAFSIESVGNAVGNVLKKQRGGPINSGKASGDSVPALLERGEYVLNRNAVGAIGKDKLDKINFGHHARFQSGGSVLEALGPYSIPPIQYDANHAGGNSHVHVGMSTSAAVVALGHKLQQMGFMVSEHPAFGGVHPVHTTNSLHYSNQAIDVNSAADETRAEVASIARLLNGGKFMGATMTKLKRLLLGGPDGPLKSMGQGSLDMSLKAAQSFVNSQMPKETGGFSGFGGGAWQDTLRQIAKSRGWSVPDWMKLVMGESGGNPAATNPSSGAFGLGQFLGSTLDAYAKYGAKSTDGSKQIQAMAQYISDRYGNPTTAYSTWLSRSPHWYSKGGEVLPYVGKYHQGGIAPREGLAHVAKGEHIGMAPTVEVHLHGPGMDAMVGEMYAVVDGAKVEIADYVMRQGGRGAGRSRQLARG